ncbi:hypothetical protein [Nannocystis sp.]|uniref:hypothetical protein n=1 Tax=Nannocystis sp. TaxID=1962667 RepID=UPI0025DBC51C|nr:hypothetical protein [Nannocystis sp.]MBK7825779.1 hypothetical protein [Nannocystis sp.]
MAPALASLLVALTAARDLPTTPAASSSLTKSPNHSNDPTSLPTESPVPGSSEELMALASGPDELMPSAAERELPLVHGGFAAPTAWLALWRGDAWICWDAELPTCWQRLELTGIVDLSSLRAEFVDRSTLVLGDRSEATWQVVRGDPGPRPVAWSTTPRQSPRALACGPAGALPIADDGGLRFIARPCPEARDGGDTCVHPGRSLRLHRPQPLRLRLGLELRGLADWRLHPGLGTTTTGVQLLALLAIGLDPAAWIQQRRERADLHAQARPGLRALPPPRSRGPLVAAEREALRTAVCGVAR